MFTNRKASYVTKDNVLIEAACLSTDTKPTTGIANGSILLEMDTSKVYVFNEAGAEWLEIAAGGGGGGSWTVLTEESVTTRMGQDAAPYGDITYSQLIDAETIKVTFNGVEYECPRIGEGGEYFYGGVGQSGPDFSEYPFAIMSHNDNNTLFTETAGTYNIKIEAPQK